MPTSMSTRSDATVESSPLLGGEARPSPLRRTLSFAPWALTLFAVVLAVVLGAQLRELTAQNRDLAAAARVAVAAPSMTSNAVVSAVAASTKQGPIPRRGKMSEEARKRWAPQLAQYMKAVPEDEPLWKTIKNEDLPANWDWRNVSGKNFLTPDRQQHLPVYCGGCWLFSSIHSINDRISIARNASWPPVLLSHQVMINCQDCGNCEDGGQEFCVYGYVQKHGLPDDTCAPYVAKTGTECLHDGKVGTCKPECYCSNAEPNGDHYAIGKFRRWYLSHVDHLPHGDRAAMKAEIYARGPITCGMCATDQMVYTYAGGIYKENTPCKVDDFDHEVSVSGWGVDEETGEEYWLVRNSWGTFWGEDGWFRISMYEDNAAKTGFVLGLGKVCVYGVVDVERSKDIPPTPLGKYYKWKPEA